MFFARHRERDGRDGEQALTLITQHMHDCERRSDAFTRRLDEQDQAQQRMHEQNISRLNLLTGFVIMALLGLAASLTMEIVKGYEIRAVPPAAMHIP